MHHSSPLGKNTTLRVRMQIKGFGLKVLATCLHQSNNSILGAIFPLNSYSWKLPLEFIITFISLMVTMSLVIGDTHLDLV